MSSHKFSRGKSHGFTENINSFGINCLFLKRLFVVTKIFFPHFISISTGAFVSLIVILIVEQVLGFQVGLISSKYMKVLGDHDLPQFLSVTGVSMGWIMLMVLVLTGKTYVDNIIYSFWRKNLSLHLHGKYLLDRNYYYVNVLKPLLDNSDQRMTQDVSILCRVFSDTVPNLLVIPFTLGYYVYQTIVVTGWYTPVACFVLFLIATLVNKWLMSYTSLWVARVERCEGNYRFNHMTIRTNAEVIGLYNSEDQEKTRLDGNLFILISTLAHRYLVETPLIFSVLLFSYTGAIVSYILIGVALFMGKYDDVPASDTASVISKNSYLVMYLINLFSQIVNKSSQFATIAGATHRVGELMEAMDLNSTSSSHNFHLIIKKEKPGSDVKYQSGISFEESTDSTSAPGIHVDNITIKPPEYQKTIIANLSFSVTEGSNLLVMGPSGCGKTSIIRCLKGLWNVHAGKITINATKDSVFYLPDKPYFTDGSLRDQMTYPEFGCDQNDEKMTEYLRAMNLDHLLTTVGHLDATVPWNWNDTLSLGEQQRLCFIRMLYHRPKYAILDEPTSNLSEQDEESMFGLCRENGITLLTVGHRLSLRKYHQSLLSINKDGTWSLEPL